MKGKKDKQQKEEEPKKEGEPKNEEEPKKVEEAKEKDKEVEDKKMKMRRRQLSLKSKKIIVKKICKKNGKGVKAKQEAIISVSFTSKIEHFTSSLNVILLFI